MNFLGFQHSTCYENALAERVNGMVQDAMVCITGLLVAAWLCRKLYRFALKKGKSGKKCAGCTGCDLKNMPDKPPPDECGLR